MKTICQLALLSLVASQTACDPMTPDEQFVREKTPVVVQKGRPVVVDIHSLSGNGLNQVGIRCSPELWNALTNGTGSLKVRLLSSSKEGTKIEDITPGQNKTWPLASFHGLFYISGERHAAVSVEMRFPNAPPSPVHAEIILCNTPIDTKP